MLVRNPYAGVDIVLSAHCMTGIVYDRSFQSYLRHGVLAQSDVSATIAPLRDERWASDGESIRARVLYEHTITASDMENERIGYHTRSILQYSIVGRRCIVEQCNERRSIARES